MFQLFQMSIQRLTNDLLPRRADAVPRANGGDRAVETLQDGLL